MTQPLTDVPVEPARTAARTDAWKRDQVAWNLPRAGDDEPLSLPGMDLDWAGFSQTFYAGSRRHDLRAIAAYAACRRANRDV